MTQAELAEILEVLRELQRLGWPLKVHVSHSGNSALIVLTEDRGTNTVVVQKGYLDARMAAILRDWLERQVDARGLWREYMAAFAQGHVRERLAVLSDPSVRVSGPEPMRERRPTLLEVARAVLAVAREMKNG